LNARESGGRRTCIGRSRGHVARKFGKCRLGNGAQCVASRRTSGSRRRPLATSPAVGAYPGCDAGRVVYSSSPLGGISDVKLYDIAAQQTRDVANQPYNEWRPSISGNRVVWQAWPGPDINILGTNLATGQDFTVTNAAGSQTAPMISGSTVAWEDVRSDPPERESDLVARRRDHDAPDRDPGRELRIRAPTAALPLRQEGRLPKQLTGTVAGLPRAALLLHGHRVRRAASTCTAHMAASCVIVSLRPSRVWFPKFYERACFLIAAKGTREGSVRHVQAP
jgi:hypothetical protein